MNKQTGSVLAILLGVGILFAAATNRVGNAIGALRGNTGTTTSEPPTGDKPDEPKDKTGGGGSKKGGVTSTLMRNGVHRFEQTGTVQ